MSTSVDTWKGGDNLALVDKVASIAAKHVGRCEDLIKELTIFFGGHSQKVEILKSCSERMRDIANRFKEERRNPKGSQQVPDLFQVAEKLRETKKAFLKSTMDQDRVDLTLGFDVQSPAKPTRQDLQYLTPVKNMPVKKTPTQKMFRQEVLARLQQPILTLLDLTDLEKQEATLYQEYLEEQAEAARSKSWDKASVEKENSQMARLVGIAFRALLAENVKKYEAYKSQSGQGEIRWDYNVKNLTTSENDVLYMTKASYASKMVQVRGAETMKPADLLETLEAERIKYEWFIKMFMPEKEAEKATLELEQSLGQLIQTSLLNGSEAMRMYVSMAEENRGVLDNITSLFSFYRTKFSRLKVGGVGDSKPTKSPIKVNHITEETPLDEHSMPEDVKEAFSILLQRPISKHPQGMPVSETHTQTESATVESVWQLKDNIDKVAAWVGKPKGGTKRKKALDSDSEEEPEQQEKGKGKKKAEGTTSIKKLEQRVSRMESKVGQNKSVSWADSHQRPHRERPNQQKPQPVCYDFQKGKCTRNSCRFSHGNQQGPPKERRPGPQVEIPDDACATIKAGKKCKQKGCPANHGKFNTNSKRQCWHEEKEKLCYSLYNKEGCHFLHDNSYSKNE